MNKREFFGVGVAGVSSLFLPRICEGVEDSERVGPRVELTPENLYNYAMHVHGGPIPEYEDIIAQSAHYATHYAKNVLDGPFPSGEAAIAQVAYYSYFYARFVINAPFPLGEAAIAQDGHYSCKYAMRVLRSRFPQGEAAIKKVYWHNYRTHFNLDWS